MPPRYARARSHELYATSSAGLSLGADETSKLTVASQPQSVILPLRLNAQIFSGITPPPQLLEAMAEARAAVKQPSRKNSSRKSSVPGKPTLIGPTDSQASLQFGAGQVPPTPIDTPGPTGTQQLPPRPGATSEDPPMYADAPPSYEDAIATSLPPINAARPEYVPPTAGEDTVLDRDEKKAWVA